MQTFILHLKEYFGHFQGKNDVQCMNKLALLTIVLKKEVTVTEELIDYLLCYPFVM